MKQGQAVGMLGIGVVAVGALWFAVGKLPTGDQEKQTDAGRAAVGYVQQSQAWGGSIAAWEATGATVCAGVEETDRMGRGSADTWMAAKPEGSDRIVADTLVTLMLMCMDYRKAAATGDRSGWATLPDVRTARERWWMACGQAGAWAVAAGQTDWPATCTTIGRK